LNVILCSHLSRLKTTLRRTPGPLRYINLLEGPEGHKISSFLRDRPDTQELPKALLYRERSEEFRKKYIGFMGRLNAQNASRQWWSLSFTNKKHSVAAQFSRDIFNFLLIVDLLRASPDHLVVLTDSLDLAAQVSEWADREGVKAYKLVQTPWTYRRIVKQFTPASLLKASVSAFALWFLNRRHRAAQNQERSQLVIVSHTHTRSFKGTEGYRDAYFGALVEHLSMSGSDALLWGVPYEAPFQQVKNVKTLKFGIPVVLLESTLTLRSLVICLSQAIRLFIRPLQPIGPVEIDGIDLGGLTSRAIKSECRSGELFWNLQVYFAARGLGQTLLITCCLYPYENRSWEKMLLMGIRSVSPRTQMVGYQHSSITLSHANFFLAPEETGITPLPDVMLTTGEITNEWLVREGNYPVGIIKTACALRQGQPIEIQNMRASGEITKVLVALATSLQEYGHTLAFLEKAFADVNGYDVRIRPHPNISIDSALKIYPMTRQDFYSISSGSLTDDLNWADVVLYASSTVGLESVSLGIPAVYLDLSDILDTDPMFGWDEFKWSVKEPLELVDTLRGIASLPDARFRELQSKGKEYATAYLRPPTPSLLRTFTEI
jgi:hypothetical protein